MDYFGSIVYFTLVFFVFYRLGQCQDYAYHLKLDSVGVENEKQEWRSIFLSKYHKSADFTFHIPELNAICDSPFSYSDVEVVEVFKRAVRFSLIRKTDDELYHQLFVNLLFTEMTSVDLFFGDVRWKKRQECGTQVEIYKVFQYQIYESEEIKKVQPLRLLADRILFYPKDLDAAWFSHPKCFNFVDFDYQDSRIQGVHMVMLAKTFNISPRIDTNKYVLCSENIPTHEFTLIFRNRRIADDFYSSVKYDLNNKLACDGKWLTNEVLTEIRYHNH